MRTLLGSQFVMAAAIAFATAPAMAGMFPANRGLNPDYPPRLTDLEAGVAAMAFPIGTILTVTSETSALPVPPTGDSRPIERPRLCRFRQGRSVRLMGFDREFGILVRYDVAKRDVDGECANGDLAFFSPSVVGAWTRVASEVDGSEATLRRAREAVDRIMAK